MVDEIYCLLSSQNVTCNYLFMKTCFINKIVLLSEDVHDHYHEHHQDAFCQEGQGREGQEGKGEEGHYHEHHQDEGQGREGQEGQGEEGQEGRSQEGQEG